MGFNKPFKFSVVNEYTSRIDQFEVFGSLRRCQCSQERLFGIPGRGIENIDIEIIADMIGRVDRLVVSDQFNGGETFIDSIFPSNRYIDGKIIDRVNVNNKGLSLQIP